MVVWGSQTSCQLKPRWPFFFGLFWTLSSTRCYHPYTAPQCSILCKLWRLFFMKILELTAVSVIPKPACPHDMVKVCEIPVWCLTRISWPVSRLFMDCGAATQFLIVWINGWTGVPNKVYAIHVGNQVPTRLLKIAVLVKKVIPASQNAMSQRSIFTATRKVLPGLQDMWLEKVNKCSRLSKIMQTPHRKACGQPGDRTWNPLALRWQC